MTRLPVPEHGATNPAVEWRGTNELPIYVTPEGLHPSNRGRVAPTRSACNGTTSGLTSMQTTAQLAMAAAAKSNRVSNPLPGRATTHARNGADCCGTTLVAFCTAILSLEAVRAER